ncbi:MAG: hemerythrin domain-containing protein [Gammaproteobacteria bacterium]
MQFQFIEPAEDFSDGLNVLYSYHQQFLERGRELLALVDRIQSDGMNEEHAYQCVQLHCYYQRANPLHHQDEERVLFPLIVQRSFLIDGMIERLALDHEEIEEAWVELAPLLSGDRRSRKAETTGPRIRKAATRACDPRERRFFPRS